MPRSARTCRWAGGAPWVTVSDAKRREVAEQLRRVIAWEMSAQIGVKRAVPDMPPLIVDSLLDFFDVTLKPGVDLSHLD